MNAKFPSDKQDKFMLRLPDGMRDRIAQEAEANGRSMNAEIVQRLEASFPLDIESEMLQQRMTELSSVKKGLEIHNVQRAANLARMQDMNPTDAEFAACQMRELVHAARITDLISVAGVVEADIARLHRLLQARKDAAYSDPRQPFD